MRHLCIPLVIALTLGTSDVLAQEKESISAADFIAVQKIMKSMKQLSASRSFKCKFDPGKMILATSSGFEWKDGPFSGDGVTQIDNVDLQKHSARVIGNHGATNLMAIPTDFGLSFIETPGATFNVYTIYATPTGTQDEFLAVTSRHYQMLGKVAPQIYPGRCKIWGK